MEKAVRHLAQISAVVVAALVVGCGNKVLDWRNAELSNGKIFASGANTPFSGKLTNVPAYELPLQALQPFAEVLANVTRVPRFAALSLAARRIAGGRNGLCDAVVKDGALDGDVRCSLGPNQWLELQYRSGTLEGAVTVFDQDSADKVLGRVDLAAGTLEGKSTIYDPATGTEIHTVGWQRGVLNGQEEMKDSAGNLLIRATVVNGKYDGKAERYDGKGNLVVTTFYKAGDVERNVRSGLSDVDNCVEDWAAALKASGLGEGTAASRAQWQAACQAGRRWNSREPTTQIQSVAAASTPSEACFQAWAAAYRKERGEDAPVSSDQANEWDVWCKNGKRPSN